MSRLGPFGVVGADGNCDIWEVPLMGGAIWPDQRGISFGGSSDGLYGDSSVFCVPPRSVFCGSRYHLRVTV